MQPTPASQLLDQAPALRGLVKAWGAALIVGLVILFAAEYGSRKLF